MTQAQRDELDRRLDELDGGDAKTISWADAKHRLRRR
jgi:putative addiction module component (TIGR02574 family)